MSKESKKLNIYCHVSENSGVGHYREYLPALAIRENNLANIWINDYRFGEGDHKNPTIGELHKILVDFDIDIISVGRQDTPDFYALWGGIREHFNIPIVLDTDDNVHHVRPTNPGYGGYHPGSEHLTWSKYAIEKVFDGITVSTQDLKDFYSKWNPKIYVLPNSLNIKEWDSFPRKEHNDGFIRIGFIGSGAHSEGIKIIKKPLLDIMIKYPKVKFLVTHVYQSHFADFPEEIKKRIEPVPWIPLKEWPKRLKELGIDIGLAPLADNMFNRAKSNLRWMEYGLAGMAPIVSPVKAYGCVNNGISGLVAKEQQDWFNAMERLITNKELRYTISKGAYEQIARDYDVNKNAYLWEKAYREIHDKYHQFFGEKKKFQKLKNNTYRLLR